jgi:hypothetical protein
MVNKELIMTRWLRQIRWMFASKLSQQVSGIVSEKVIPDITKLYREQKITAGNLENMTHFVGEIIKEFPKLEERVIKLETDSTFLLAQLDAKEKELAECHTQLSQVLENEVSQSPCLGERFRTSRGTKRSAKKKD